MSTQPHTLTYEQMMALFLETREQIQATATIVKQTQKEIGALGSRVGDIIMGMVKGNIIDKFQDLGYDVTGCSPNKSFKNNKLVPC